MNPVQLAADVRHVDQVLGALNRDSDAGGLYILFIRFTGEKMAALHEVHALQIKNTHIPRFVLRPRISRINTFLVCMLTMLLVALALMVRSAQMLANEVNSLADAVWVEQENRHFTEIVSRTITVYNIEGRRSQVMVDGWMVLEQPIVANPARSSRFLVLVVNANNVVAQRFACRYYAEYPELATYILRTTYGASNWLEIALSRTDVESITNVASLLKHESRMYEIMQSEYNQESKDAEVKEIN